jgi:hypothetical protein
MRTSRDQALAARSAPAWSGHVGFGGGLVDEDQSLWIQSVLKLS